MKKFLSSLAVVAMTSSLGATAFAASPDIYIVNFRSDKDTRSVQFDSELASALSMLDTSYEQVNIDSSNAARWEKSAHDAFDHDIVPLFNQWVGLPGFVAVVDANNKRVLGCVNVEFKAAEIASEVKRMSAQASGQGYVSRASTFSKTTQCPAPFNVDPGE